MGPICNTNHSKQYETKLAKRNLCLIILLFNSDYKFNTSRREILKLCTIIRLIIQDLSLWYKIQKNVHNKSVYIHRK